MYSINIGCENALKTSSDLYSCRSEAEIFSNGTFSICHCSNPSPLNLTPTQIKIVYEPAKNDCRSVKFQDVSKMEVELSLIKQ